MNDREYLEVETPMLQPIHGGATARPFITHINAYDMDLYLRIAIELYLKRLVVGGIEKVYEISRNFRNEGADSSHNPEFTMLEAYEAYGDYDTIATLTREMYQAAVVAALGDTVVGARGPGDRPGRRHVAAGHPVRRGLGGGRRGAHHRRRRSSRSASCSTCGAWSTTPSWGQGRLVQELFEELVEHTLIQPTFVRDYPLETSPLARTHRADPLLTEKWDLIGFGTELGTGYSELIDPIEQRRRLTEQSLLAAGGDAEAMQLDEDFLRALEYAMPPTGGVGIGIDRMIMAFTGKNIRETILFPLVKPE